MSMLAGPRRKQKVINLRAKNSAWSNDSNKFGQRMLEKMGWSSGKGLGAKENGIVEHVVARYKNDEKGLGFEDKNDQWTKHEDDFNALLANLSNGDTNEEKLHSGVSLEHKSKKSKTRVHYHKFTRGKDLTRYSEKDLANIFGKKSLKNIEAKPEVLKEDTNIVEITEQVFTEKGSMEDYFKNKFSALKTKISFNYQENVDEADYSFRGFAGTQQEPENQETNVAFEGFSFYNKNTAINTEIPEDVEKPKKKKKDKSKKHLLESEKTEYCVENNDLPENDEPIKNKKSKTYPNEIDNNELPTNEIKTKKKKSKSNHKEIDPNELATNEVIAKKKKSKPNLENGTDELLNQELVKKKNKESSEELIKQNEVLVEDCYVPKKKKKRK